MKLDTGLLTLLDMFDVIKYYYTFPCLLGRRMCYGNFRPQKLILSFLLEINCKTNSLVFTKILFCL